jgi:hypothetical protein
LLYLAVKDKYNSTSTHKNVIRLENIKTIWLRNSHTWFRKKAALLIGRLKRGCPY